VLPVRIELTTSPLPRGCSTTELRQLCSRGQGTGIHEAPPIGKASGYARPMPTGTVSLSLRDGRFPSRQTRTGPIRSGTRGEPGVFLHKLSLVDPENNPVPLQVWRIAAGEMKKEAFRNTWTTACFPVPIEPSPLRVRRKSHRRSEEHTSELQSRENLVC